MLMVFSFPLFTECSGEITEHDDGDLWISVMDKCMLCQCKVNYESIILFTNIHPLKMNKI